MDKNVDIIDARLETRPAEPAEQIKFDLRVFISTLNGLRTSPLFRNSNNHEIAPFLVGARIGYFGANEWTDEFVDARGESTIQLQDVQVEKLEGDAAVVSVTTAVVGDADPHARYRIGNAEAPVTETLTLKRETMAGQRQKERWQIEPSTFQEAWLLNLTSLQHVAFFAGQRPETQAQLRATISARRLKLCSLGVLMLVHDYDGHFAFTNTYWREAVNTYIRNERALTIPGTHDNYTFNENLSDRDMAQVTDPAHTVLFYEGQDQKPIFRYDGRAVIAYVDGHVGLVSPEEAEELLWNL